MYFCLRWWSMESLLMGQTVASLVHQPRSNPSHFTIICRKKKGEEITNLIFWSYKNNQRRKENLRAHKICSVLFECVTCRWLSGFKKNQTNHTDTKKRIQNTLCCKLLRCVMSAKPETNLSGSLINVCYDWCSFTPNIIRATDPLLNACP